MPGRASRLVRGLWRADVLGPAAMVMLWGFSTGSWVLWAGTGASLPRAVLGRGLVMVCWQSTARWRGIGQATWSLGAHYRFNGRPVRWFIARPLWRSSIAEVSWTIVVGPGHVQVPLIYPAVLSLGLPGISVWRRWRRRRDGRCGWCGYDLSGVPAGPCPECGRSESIARGDVERAS